ncbi:MAG TPA: hypothetical protein VLZ83_14280 [Edaphocola sp.]|nr:hypothetical protein [Edaphocola sp.]
MKKLIFAIGILGSLSISTGLMAQENNQTEISQDFFNGDLFDGFSGTLIYSLYQNNTYLMNAFKANIINKEEALRTSRQQVNLIKYVNDLIDNKLINEKNDPLIKSQDYNYLKNIKSAIILLGNQAEGLNSYIEGDINGKKRFESNKKLAYKKVLKVMDKKQ